MFEAHFEVARAEPFSYYLKRAAHLDASTREAVVANAQAECDSFFPAIPDDFIGPHYICPIKRGLRRKRFMAALRIKESVNA